MKKIKIILVILILILLTGCKGEYNLNINKDLTIDEEIKISIENKNDAYEKTISLFENNDIDDSMYNVTQNDEYINIQYKETFNNFQDYILNSKFYSRIINYEDYYKDNKKITYKGYANLKLDDNVDDSNLNNSFYITNLKINLTTPFVMKENNADSSSNNTYTWVLKESDTHKIINFSFNYLKNNNMYLIVIVLCVGIVAGVSGIIIHNYFKGKEY